jgi:hypothetical protein
VQTYPAVVRDSAGSTYLVRDAGPELGHTFAAIPCKIGEINGRPAHIPKAKATERLIRRAGCHVVSGTMPLIAEAA